MTARTPRGGGAARLSPEGRAVLHACAVLGGLTSFFCLRGPRLSRPELQFGRELIVSHPGDPLNKPCPSEITAEREGPRHCSPRRPP